MQAVLRNTLTLSTAHRLPLKPKLKGLLLTLRLLEAIHILQLERGLFPLLC